MARQEALVLGHHQRHPRAIGGGDDPAALGERERERLLDEHVPAASIAASATDAWRSGVTQTSSASHATSRRSASTSGRPARRRVVRAPSRERLVEIADRDEIDPVRKLRVRGEMV
jgi:hypothetical protein